MERRGNRRRPKKEQGCCLQRRSEMASHPPSPPPQARRIQHSKKDRGGRMVRYCVEPKKKERKQSLLSRHRPNISSFNPPKKSLKLGLQVSSFRRNNAYILSQPNIIIVVSSQDPR
ncbi:hypothetical protein EJ02DRAFT_96946 [Clathrospora elynae]|uniref:Uncharacterized protein n=1 Tax=Clathrospora elynae TaxID=706981 RepID=A0A6A5S8C0_9PLEO|nr:hypothetical protein EJ02DRAFT_96946 [Clathrospora elynae]